MAIHFFLDNILAKCFLLSQHYLVFWTTPWVPAKLRIFFLHRQHILLFYNTIFWFFVWKYVLLVFTSVTFWVHCAIIKLYIVANLYILIHQGHRPILVYQPPATSSKNSRRGVCILSLHDLMCNMGVVCHRISLTWNICEGPLMHYIELHTKHTCIMPWWLLTLCTDKYSILW